LISSREELFVGEWQVVGLISCDPSLEVGIFLSLSMGLDRKRNGGKEACAEGKDWGSDWFHFWLTLRV
jgi:hypothetical protein